MNRLDVAALATLAVGVSSLALDSTFKSNVSLMAGPHAPEILAAIGTVGMIGSQIIRVLGSPSTAPNDSAPQPTIPTTPHLFLSGVDPMTFFQEVAVAAVILPQLVAIDQEIKAGQSATTPGVHTYIDGKPGTITITWTPDAPAQNATPTA
jgi:hypothetical protein